MYPQMRQQRLHPQTAFPRETPCTLPTVCDTASNRIVQNFPIFVPDSRHLHAPVQRNAPQPWFPSVFISIRPACYAPLPERAFRWHSASCSIPFSTSMYWTIWRRRTTKRTSSTTSTRLRTGGPTRKLIAAFTTTASCFSTWKERNRGQPSPRPSNA